MSKASDNARFDEIENLVTSEEYKDKLKAAETTSQLREIGTEAGVDVEVQAPLGKDGVGVSTLGGYNNGININSKNKGTALDFMKFIINEDNQKSFAEQSFPPVLASIYDDPQLQQEFPYLPALKESLENAAPRPVSPFYSAISKAIQDNAYAALTDDKSVDDATADMKAAIESASQG